MDNKKELTAEETIAKLEKTVAEQAEVIKELSDANARLEKQGKVNKPLITVEGKDYTVLPKFIYKKKEVTAEMVQADKDLAAELVKGGFGVTAI